MNRTLKDILYMLCICTVLFGFGACKSQPEPKPEPKPEPVRPAEPTRNEEQENANRLLNELAKVRAQAVPQPMLRRPQQKKGMNRITLLQLRRKRKLP